MTDSDQLLLKTCKTGHESCHLIHTVPYLLLLDGERNWLNPEGMKYSILYGVLCVSLYSMYLFLCMVSGMYPPIPPYKTLKV
ncbi:hypothetical protein BDV39DRAFT_185730 [Aspergillus sergii]|uniref:Uncharacterized protein n=1 Tax=Aspergillus sergii TaxID=1034303 RepID=A0A5N6WL77_9EURO|nr:hypothetical protein BDV39DRAFT_185730 [Aspergillus sergii]